jgi:C-terminal processing protease CtpA/Prc
MRQAPARLALALIAATPALTVPPLCAGAQDDAPAPPAVSYEGAFHELYTVLARRYPGFDLKGIDWAAVGRELLPRARAVHDDASFGLLCMELVARLEDNHAQLLPGTAPLPVPPMPRWDPGLACLEDDRGAAVVFHVDAGGTADRAGVRPGMTVISVNGRPVADVLADAMREYRRWSGSSSERRLRHDVHRGLLRQMERGAAVVLVARDAAGVEHRFDLTADHDVRSVPRRPVPIPGIADGASVAWTVLAGRQDGALPVEQAAVGYVSVRRIDEDLIPGLDRAAAALEDVLGVIIDVRGNSGGGFDDQRSHVNFMAAGAGSEPDRPRFPGSYAVLIDARCVSAGEGWASWFVATGRARLFGETTCGASARKEDHAVRGGLFRVRFPVKFYRGFLDRIIERRGLEPDVPLMPNAADLAAGRDTVLEAAHRFVLEGVRD